MINQANAWTLSWCLSWRFIKTIVPLQGDGPIGFVGLGNMGGPMAKNLMDVGHEIVVNDIYPEAMADMEKLGATTAASPSEVASKATRIITMLPSR